MTIESFNGVFWLEFVFLELSSWKQFQVTAFFDSMHKWLVTKSFTVYLYLSLLSRTAADVYVCKFEIRRKAGC